jgi:hypothetical protein
MKARPAIRILTLAALVSSGFTLLSGFLGVPGFIGDAQAQTPGMRSLKQTLGSTATGSPRSLKETLTSRSARAATGSASADEEVGSISGGERFIRRNRRRTAFVGRDLSEMSSFVGEIQGSTSGNVRTSASSLRMRLQRNANLTAQRTNQTSRGMYEPPLAIGFAVEPLAPVAQEASLEELLNASARIHHVGPLSVTVDARTATLEGVVASAEDRQLAEAYLRFEPSLSTVVNHLTIQPRPERQ